MNKEKKEFISIVVTALVMVAFLIGIVGGIFYATSEDGYAIDRHLDGCDESANCGCFEKLTGRF